MKRDRLGVGLSLCTLMLLTLSGCVPAGRPAAIPVAKHEKATKEDDSGGLCTTVATCESACKGTKKGDPQSCEELGHMYEWAQGGANQDFTLAAKFYDQACAAKWGSSCTFLGKMHEGGRGTGKPNFKTAYSLYVRACDLKDSDGCFEVATMLTQGEHLPKDENGAVNPFGRACLFGHAVGCSQVRIRLAAKNPRAMNLLDQFKRQCKSQDKQACKAIAAIETKAR